MHRLGVLLYMQFGGDPYPHRRGETAITEVMLHV